MTESIESLIRSEPSLRGLRVVERFEGGEGGAALVRRPDGKGGSQVLRVGVEDSIELSLLAQLRHPRVPRLVAFGGPADDPARRFVLRDFVEGSTLRLGPRDPAEVVALATDLCQTLAYVHGLGISHGDLKPKNLIESGDGVHLIDFGLATHPGAARSSGGTRGFAAPERVAGASPKTDLYSLGVILLLCLLDPGSVGEEVLREDFSRHLCDRVDWSTTKVPAVLELVLRSLLEVDPQRRTADVQEVLDQLLGGTGRPSVAALQLDPTVLWRDQLDELGDERGAVVRVVGDDRETRHTLLLRRASRLGVHGAIRDDDRDEESAFAPESADGAELRVDLHPILVADLGPELGRLFGLETEAADRAAGFLLEGGPLSRTDLETSIRALAESGALVPDGAGFRWPEAAAHRLGNRSEDLVRISVPASLRELVAGGRIELGFAEWRRRSVADPAAESAWRHSLAEGLIDLGEHARALPLLFDRDDLRARALLGLGRSEEAEEICQQSGSSEHSDWNAMRADLASRRGRHDEALGLVRSDSDDPGERVLHAGLLLRAGRNDEARIRLDELRLDPQIAERPSLSAVVQSNLGEARRRLGDRDGALRAFDEARSLRRRQGHLRQMAVLDLNLGVLLKEAHDFDGALECQRRALSSLRHLQDRETAGIALLNIAVLHAERGDISAARARLDEAGIELDAADYRALDAFRAVFGARLRWLQGDRKAALRELASRGGTDFDPRTEEEFERLVGLLTTAVAEEEPAQRHASVAFRTLVAINRRLASGEDVTQTLRAILDAAVSVTGARSAYLVVERNGAIQTELRSDGASPSDRAFSRSLANRAIHERRTLRESDVLADKGLEEMPSVKNLERRSALCAPFRTSGGLRGALYAEHVGRADVFGADEAELCEALAEQAAIGLSITEADGSRTEESSTPSTRRRRQPAKIQWIGRSPEMERLRAEVTRFAASGLSVLVLGETGTGKELVARALHRDGPGADTPFVGENCSAIPAELIESELFGSVKGAFTGADQDRAGLFEQADGGTLFLDEIGDMPPPMQAKLLRALQEGVVRRVGGQESIPVSFQLVTATHKDLWAMVEAGTFRQDLYFRLTAGIVRVPALRDRGTDLLLIADDFLSRLNKEHGRSVVRGEAFTERLIAYDWPGNVRELQHVLTRAFLLSEASELPVSQVPTERSAPETSASDWPVLTLEEATRRTILAALRRTGGDKTKAARLLEMSRTALYDRIRRDPELGEV